MKTVSTEYACNGRNIVVNTELSIKGERGRFKFKYYTESDNGDWITVYGGPNGVGMWRSFEPKRIKTVHWKNKLR